MSDDHGNEYVDELVDKLRTQFSDQKLTVNTPNGAHNQSDVQMGTESEEPVTIDHALKYEVWGGSISGRDSFVGADPVKDGVFAHRHTARMKYAQTVLEAERQLKIELEGAVGADVVMGHCPEAVAVEKVMGQKYLPKTAENTKAECCSKTPECEDFTCSSPDGPPPADVKATTADDSGGNIVVTVTVSLPRPR